MPDVQFGVVVPTGTFDKFRRQHYVNDADRLLNYVKGPFTSAWLVDHLQFEDTDTLEAWTTRS